MAELTFTYGAMGSCKTAYALMMAHSHNERHRDALLVKPKIDTRDGQRIIKSRAGLQHECILLEELLTLTNEEIQHYKLIIVDEVQFASKEQIDFLAHIVDDLNINVECFGLRTDFQGNLFEGANYLFSCADETNQLPSVCWCGRPAIFNARIHNNKVIKHGEQIQLGGDSSYISLCRKHYNEGNLG